MVVLTGRVSHDIHDRKQVFGRTVHLSSKAMTRAIEDEVVWQPGLLSGFLELLATVVRCPSPARLEGKIHPSFCSEYRARSACRTRGLIGTNLRPLGDLLS
jgi:hypothetical protein